MNILKDKYKEYTEIQKKRVLEFIQKNPELNQTEIAEALEMSRMSVYKYRQLLREDGHEI